MTQTSMAGSTVLVTGCTCGIGRATTLGLARLGANVAITAQAAGHAEDAAREIRSTGVQVEVLLSDLSEQSQVRQVAREVLRRLPDLDVLLNKSAATGARVT